MYGGCGKLIKDEVEGILDYKQWRYFTIVKHEQVSHDSCMVTFAISDPSKPLDIKVGGHIRIGKVFVGFGCVDV